MEDLYNNREKSKSSIDRRATTDDSAAYAAKIKEKIEQANAPRRMSTPDDISDSTLEAKIKTKVAAEGKPNRNRPSNLSASMPPSMDNTSSYSESYEDKIRRKMLDDKGKQSTTVSNGSVFAKTVTAASAKDKFEAKLRAKAEEARQKKKKSSSSNRPKTLSASMPPASQNIELDDDYTAEKRRSLSSLAEEVDEIDHETSGAETVSLEEVFSELQKLNSSLRGLRSVPVSHSSFNNVLDKLDTLGMEEMLKKRWDDQYNAVKSYKDEHDTCCIPTSHPLSAWANAQQKQYALYKQRLPTMLTKKRYNKLKDIGFDECIKWTESESLKASGKKKSKSSSRSRRATIGSDGLTLDEKIQMKKSDFKKQTSLPIEEVDDRRCQLSKEASLKMENIPKRSSNGTSANDNDLNIESFSELGDILALVAKAEDDESTLDRIHE